MNETEQTEVEEQIENEGEKKILAVIVSWHPAGRNRGTGFARVIGGDGQGDRSRPSLFIKHENIVTLGADTLRPGKFIECDVGPCSKGFVSPTALNISIFMDEEKEGNE